MEVEVPGSSWLDCRMWGGGTPSPFLYGIMCSSPIYITPQKIIFTALVFIFIIKSVFIKRRSASCPDGHIYKYNQKRVHKILSDKRRKLRDLLNDPILARDVETRYGDISSLRESVKQWQEDEFTLQKKDVDVGVKVGGSLTVPWIKVSTVWLCLIFFLTLNLNFSTLTLMILTASLVHIIDNLLIQRAAVAKHVAGTGGKTYKSKPEASCVVAAAGVPLQIKDSYETPTIPEMHDAEIGIPVEGIERYP